MGEQDGRRSDRSAALNRLERRLVAFATVAMLTVGVSGPALAAQPPGKAPNNAASNSASGNCVAMTSGVLFYEKRGIKLGKDVSQFASDPPGGQAAFIQGELAKDPGQGDDCFG